MTDALDPKASQRTTVFRVLGGAAIFAIAALSTWLAPRYPWVATVAPIACAYIGKLVGVPVDSIVELALRLMEPSRVATLAVRAIQSMPPERSAQATRRIIASIAPPMAPFVHPPVALIPDDETTDAGSPFDKGSQR